MIKKITDRDKTELFSIKKVPETPPAASYIGNLGHNRVQV